MTRLSPSFGGLEAEPTTAAFLSPPPSNFSVSMRLKFTPLRVASGTKAQTCYKRSSLQRIVIHRLTGALRLRPSPSVIWKKPRPMWLDQGFPFQRGDRRDNHRDDHSIPNSAELSLRSILPAALTGNVPDEGSIMVGTPLPTYPRSPDISLGRASLNWRRLRPAPFLCVAARPETIETF
jgi:hypothetical protein